LREWFQRLEGTDGMAAETREQIAFRMTQTSEFREHWWTGCSRSSSIVALLKRTSGPPWKAHITLGAPEYSLPRKLRKAIYFPLLDQGASSTVCWAELLS